MAKRNSVPLNDWQFQLVTDSAIWHHLSRAKVVELALVTLAKQSGGPPGATLRGPDQAAAWVEDQLVTRTAERERELRSAGWAPPDGGPRTSADRRNHPPLSSLSNKKEKNKERPYYPPPPEN